MALNLTESGGVPVIEVSGKFFGSLEGDQFNSMVQDLKDAGKTNLVIDLAKTDLMDSSAIGALIGNLTSLRKVDGDMRLANMKKRIRNLFLMTRLLGSVFESYDSLDEAVNSFG